MKQKRNEAKRTSRNNLILAYAKPKAIESWLKRLESFRPKKEALKNAH